MVPPTGIVFLFLLATLTLILGMALGWAWGVIAMKAAMAARPEAETQARLQALGQMAYSQANATGQSVPAVQQVLVYNGWMLDSRVTAVYYCLINLFIYFMVRILLFPPSRSQSYDQYTEYSIGPSPGKESEIHSDSDFCDDRCRCHPYCWTIASNIQWNYPQSLD